MLSENQLFKWKITQAGTDNVQEKVMAYCVVQAVV